jgi:hypothetical protein
MSVIYCVKVNYLYILNSGKMYFTQFCKSDFSKPFLLVMIRRKYIKKSLISSKSGDKFIAGNTDVF